MDYFSVEKLQSAVDDLHERMLNFQRFDRIGEIHAYCDNLETEVLINFESAFNHLQQLQVKTLGEVSEYRSRLIESQQRVALLDASSYSAHQTTFIQHLPELIKFRSRIPKLNRFKRTCTECTIDALMRAIKDLEAELRKEIFGGSFMRFKPNRFFSVLTDHVGSFEYFEDPIPPKCKRVKFDIERYRDTIECTKITQTSFLPDDRVVFCNLDRRIFIFRASDLTFLEELPELTRSFIVVPNQRLVIGRMDGELRIYDLSKPPDADGKRDFVILDSNTDRARRAIISQVLFPNGNLVTSDLKGLIEIWDLRMAGTDKALLLSLDEKLPCLLGVLSNGFIVSCAVKANTTSILKLWDLKSSQPLRVIDTQLVFVLSLLVLPNDQVALGGCHGNIAVYDLFDMQQVWTFNLVTHESILALAYSPNGCLMAADKMLYHFWDLQTGRQVQALGSGLLHEPLSIHISSDGSMRMAASGSNFGLQISTLKIIDSSGDISFQNILNDLIKTFLICINI